MMPAKLPKDASPGQLEVRVLSARDLKSVEMFGRQDPFFRVVVGTNQPWRSRTCVDAGKKPVWNEVNKFPITGKERDIRVEVWDSNAVTSDTLIGAAVVPLANVLALGNESNRVVICDAKGKTAGEVELVLVFHKEAKDKVGKMDPYMAGQMAPGAGYMNQAPAGYAQHPQQAPAAPYGAQPAYAQAAPMQQQAYQQQPAYPQSAPTQQAYQQQQPAYPQSMPAQQAYHAPAQYGATPAGYPPGSSPYAATSAPAYPPAQSNPYGAAGAQGYAPQQAPYGAPAQQGYAPQPQMYGAPAVSYPPAASTPYPPVNIFGAAPPNTGIPPPYH